ncbi:hypothetical protein QVD17_18084 [Tagetes erecta]|uniref:Uncharacterized protein n=1 Tax=Tagetes erecta TaxID=13708 RepID=A0AAD8KGX1_TARER|nr:hypothetical protein QVD17_18084 [Tagetes erecta]
MAIIGAGIFVKSELVVLKAIWSQSKFRIWSRSFGTWACVDGSIVGGLEKTDYVFSWRLGADGNDDIIELLMSHVKWNFMLLNSLIGREKLTSASFLCWPAACAGGGAPVPIAAESKKEESVEVKKRSQ